MEIGEVKIFINSEVWEQVFSFLDVPSLLISSLVSKDFLYFSTSAKIMEKIKLRLNFDCSSEAVTTIDDLVELMENPDELTREYKHLEIFRFSEAYLDDEVQEVFSNFSASIGRSGLLSLKLVECEINRDIVLSMFQNMEQLTELYVDKVELEVLGAAMTRDEEAEVIAPMPNLRSFHLLKSDFFLFMLIQRCEALHELKISEPSFSRDDIVKMEDFMLKQSGLKSLTLENFRFNSSFSSSRLSDVPFQLETLSLKAVKWDIIDHGFKFLKSQRNLKNLHLKDYDDYNFLTSTLKHFTRLSSLRSLEIDTIHNVDIRNLEFIGDIINKNVEELSLTIRDSNSSLHIELLKSFPNLKKLTIVDKIRENSNDLVQLLIGFERLEVLNLTSKIIEIENLKYPNLKSFAITVENDLRIISRLTQFFQNNKNISDVSLKLQTALSSEELSFLPRSVEILNITNICIISAKCVDNISQFLPKLKFLETESQLKESTKIECKRKFREKNIRFENSANNKCK